MPNSPIVESAVAVVATWFAALRGRARAVTRCGLLVVLAAACAPSPMGGIISGPISASVGPPADPGALLTTAVLSLRVTVRNAGGDSTHVECRAYIANTPVFGGFILRTAHATGATTEPVAPGASTVVVIVAPEAPVLVTDQGVDVAYRVACGGPGMVDGPDEAPAF